MKTHRPATASEESGTATRSGPAGPGITTRLVGPGGDLEAMRKEIAAAGG